VSTPPTLFGYVGVAADIRKGHGGSGFGGVGGVPGVLGLGERRGGCVVVVRVWLAVAAVAAVAGEAAALGWLVGGQLWQWWGATGFGG
jgi:hypothetical protein